MPWSNQNEVFQIAMGKSLQA